jgi:hypothetical protein
MNTIKTIALSAAICMLYSSKAIIAAEQENITTEELQKKLQQFKSECENVTQDEVTSVVEYLRNNPNIKHEYSNLIKEIVTNTWHKATNCSIACKQDTFAVQLYEASKNHSMRDTDLANAHKHFACAENCSNIFAEFEKLSEEK